MKKIVFLLLISLVLPLFIACGESDERGPGAESNVPPPPETIETTAAETTEARLPTTLADTSLDGFTMTFLGRFTVDTFNETGIYAPELNGEAVNDAVYERNRRVMDAYDFNIEYADRGNDNFLPDLKKAVAAGDDLFQGVLYGAYHLSQLVPTGHLLDLRSLDNLALDMPWWSNTMNEEISVGGRLYMTLNAFLFNAKVNLYHILFNQKLAENYGVKPADLYDKAREGAWTLDDYAGLITLANGDLNGDGVHDHQDLWGCGAESYTAYSVAVGLDVRFVEKDKDDIPHISAGEERNINGILQTLNLFADGEHILVTENITGIEGSKYTYANNMMVNGQLFTMIGSLRSFIRDMEDDYGVLPMPKRTEEQENYRHITTVYNAPVLALAVTCREPEKAAFVCEALAYDSYYETLPVFYENFLNTKMVRDDESVEMLRIIHDSVTFELSGLYILDAFVTPLTSAAQSHKTDFASTVAAASEKAETKLAGIVETILAQ